MRRLPSDARGRQNQGDNARESACQCLDPLQGRRENQGYHDEDGQRPPGGCDRTRKRLQRVYA